MSRPKSDAGTTKWAFPLMEQSEQLQSQTAIRSGSHRNLPLTAPQWHATEWLRSALGAASSGAEEDMVCKVASGLQWRRSRRAGAGHPGDGGVFFVDQPGGGSCYRKNPSGRFSGTEVCLQREAPGGALARQTSFESRPSPTFQQFPPFPLPPSPVGALIALTISPTTTA